MNQSLETLSASQLRQAANIQEKIESLQHDLAEILGGSLAPRQRSKLSPQGLANIRAGVRKRMALAKGQKAGAARPKRKMSAAARAKLAAIARARWKKVKAQGKSAL